MGVFNRLALTDNDGNLHPKIIKALMANKNFRPSGGSSSGGPATVSDPENGVVRIATDSSAEVVMPVIDAEGHFSGAALSAINSLFTTKFLKTQERAVWVPTYWWADYYNDGEPGKVSKWAKVLAKPYTPELVVININSGSGDRFDDDFLQQSRRAKAAGALVLGYVRTTWGERNPEEIYTECANHVKWYGVDGFFLDEYPNGWSHQAGLEKTMQKIYDHIKRVYPDKLIIGNPGANTVTDMVTATDVSMTYENSASIYLGEGGENDGRGEFARWEYRDFPAWRFWHCVHDVKNPEQAIKILRKMSKLPVRAVYLTDDTIYTESGERIANPYDEPPVQWLWELQHAWTKGDLLFDYFVEKNYPQYKDVR